MFLKDCWYVAAWGSEVTSAPLARTICGEPIVLFRAANGMVVALEDRCCHRNLPLSMGKVEGNDIRCGYHGLKFDRSGACTEVPGQTQVPPGACVRSHKLVERWKLVWIWIGDAAKADESDLPDWHYIDDPAWAAIAGNDAKPIHMKCNWELHNDNLLDLSHVVYVHPGTLGSAGMEQYPVQTDRFARSVRMTRFMPDVQPMPMWSKLLNLSGNMDRWQVAEIVVPSHCTIDAGFAPAGTAKPNEDRAKSAYLTILLTATPETESTSFMFYAQLRNFALDDAELTKRFAENSRIIFEEDVAVLEAQQRTFSARPNAPTIDINVDAPGLAMRRLVAQHRVA
jgi:vanillate O-demethylase monooxygenase subunit